MVGPGVELTALKTLKLGSNDVGDVGVDLKSGTLAYPSLSVALIECPFDPVEIHIYGHPLLGDQNLGYFQHKHLGCYQSWMPWAPTCR